MSLKLFEDSWEQGSTTPDDTEITTTILYFSTEEKKEFTKLCKKGIEKMFGEERFEKGNVPDLLINILRKYNEED